MFRLTCSWPLPSLNISCSYGRLKFIVEVSFVDMMSCLGLTEVNVDSGDITVCSTCGTLKAVTRSGNINASLSHHDDVVLKSREGTYFE